MTRLRLLFRPRASKRAVRRLYAKHLVWKLLQKKIAERNDRITAAMFAAGYNQGPSRETVLTFEAIADARRKLEEALRVPMSGRPDIAGTYRNHGFRYYRHMPYGLGHLIGDDRGHRPSIAQETGK